MTKFTEKATAITPNREIQPDEYFNETDHLIYCSKCNTPRQCRHELQGKVLIPSIEYYGAAEPPVRCDESHLSGLTEPPHLFCY